MSHRPFCWVCRRPQSHCYCQWIRSFAPSVRFLILMHPMEARRSIATGRMTHLTLSNSVLRVGIDFTRDKVVNEMITSMPSYLLFPSPTAMDAAQISQADPMCVVVPDGTWRTVKRMMRESENLAHLPRLSLQPQAPSGFLVRRQPREGCLATIEATAQLLSLWGESRSHHLTEVFTKFVRQQHAHVIGCDDAL